MKKPDSESSWSSSSSYTSEVSEVEDDQEVEVHSEVEDDQEVEDQEVDLRESKAKERMSKRLKSKDEDDQREKKVIGTENNSTEIDQIMKEWIGKHSKDEIINILQESDGYSCPFTKCGKKYKNYNGLLYHLEKFVHSLHEILHQGQTVKIDGGVFKVEGLKVKFMDKKKIYSLTVLMENSSETRMETRVETRIDRIDKFGKVDLGVYPSKGLVQTFKREKHSITNHDSFIEILKNEELKVFLPEPEEIKIKIKKQVVSIPLFMGFSQDKVGKKGSYRNRWILNTGLALGGLDYCPLDGTKQYLAVGGNKNKHENIIMGRVQFEDFPDDPRMAQMIQIWELDGDQTPKMVLGLAHRYGCVFDLKWCPCIATTEGAGGQLGFLAVSFGDGSCRVFSVPNPRLIESADCDEMIIGT